MPAATDVVIGGVVDTNFKSIAEAATLALQSALAMQMQNATSFQQTMNNMLATHMNIVNSVNGGMLAEALGQRAGIDVSEGLGVAAAQRGDLAKVQAELGAVAAQLQILVKSAQTTPPVTAPGPAV